MSSYKRRSNKLSGTKGMVSFFAIALIIGGMVYLMFMSQVKRQQSKVVTDPIILTNPGGAVEYIIDDETMKEVEDMDDDTGLKHIFKKLTGKDPSEEK